MPQPTVGFIGLGLMGRPMCQNLLKAGFPLVVWNRTASRADSLVAAGARLAASPKEAAAAADILITIVSDPPALEEVLWSSDPKSGGAFASLKKGAIYIDSSTVSPALARKIAQASAAAGIHFLDAPVTGGTWGAEKGELLFMIGGEAADLAAARPILSAMGKKLFHLGPNGAGQTIKLAMNLLLALQVDAFAEALALVTGAGFAGEKLTEVMQASMARASRSILATRLASLFRPQQPPAKPTIPSKALLRRTSTTPPSSNSGKSEGSIWKNDVRENDAWEISPWIDCKLKEYFLRTSSPQAREFPRRIVASPMPLPPSPVNASWGPDRGRFLLRPASSKRHPTILHSSIRTSPFRSPLTATSITASRYFTRFVSRL